MQWLNKENLNNICPYYKYIFKAFRECPYKDCSFIMFGAQYFAKFINRNKVISEKHPVYYAQMRFPMSNFAFEELDNTLKEQEQTIINYT